MVRINLLPAEILERRKYERFYPYLFIAGAVLAGIIVMTWLVMQVVVNGRNDELQQTQETVASLNQQAAALAIFEEQKVVLDQRQQVAARALGQRIDVGRVLEEIALVLPDPLWLDELIINEDSGAVIKGYTPDASGTKIDESYKSIAAGLVRLNSLDSLYDVWLTTAESESFDSFSGGTGSANVVTFEATSKIEKPSADASTTVPAPPTPAGQ